MTSWWIYENFLHDKALIHYCKCPHCNDGKGKTGKSYGKHDIWHGPFATKDEALSKARKLVRNETRICAFCRNRM